jgi:hypothetical protein
LGHVIVRNSVNNNGFVLIKIEGLAFRAFDLDLTVLADLGQQTIAETTAEFF